MPGSGCGPTAPSPSPPDLKLSRPGTRPHPASQLTCGSPRQRVRVSGVTAKLCLNGIPIGRHALRQCFPGETFPTVVRLLLFVGCLLVLCAATLALVGYRFWFETGVAYGRESVHPIRHAAVYRYGINTRFDQDPDWDRIERGMALLEEAGFRYIRQVIAWEDIERPWKGRYWNDLAGESTWKKYDRLVALAKQHNLTIIARLERPPPWAYADGKPPDDGRHQGPPARLEDYGDFAYAFAQRYRGDVQIFQIWNEPNLHGEWWPHNPDPAAYVAMLKVASQRIRQANPEAIIVAALLAPTTETGPKNLSELLFLEGIYAHGGAPYFDVVSTASYGLWHGPDDRYIARHRTNMARAVLVREVMVRNGDASKPIWAGEYGWVALPTDWQGSPSPWGNVSEATQARYTVEGMQRAQREWPWLPMINLWHFYWPQAHPDDPTQYFGIVDKEFAQRPVLAAMRDLMRAPAVLGPGYHQENHSALAWEGEWIDIANETYSLGQARGSPQAGARLRFRFQGTAVSLVVHKGPDKGIALVRINGSQALAHRLDKDAGGQAMLDLYAPEDRWQEEVLLADRLPDREHLVEIEVTGRRNLQSSDIGVDIDAIVVVRERPLWPYVLVGGLYAGFIAAIGWILAGWLRQRRQLSELLGKIMERTASGIWQHETARFGLLLTVAGLLWIVPGAAAQYLLVALLGLAALVWPRALLFVVAATLPFSVLTPTAGRLALPVNEILAALLVGSLLVHTFVRQRLVVERRVFTWWAVGLLVIGAVSLLFSHYGVFSLRELRQTIVVPVLLFLVASWLLENRQQAWRLIQAFVAGAAVAAAVALAEPIIAPSAAVQAEGVIRLSGFYPSPNHLAMIVERALPFVVAAGMFKLWPSRVAWPLAGVLAVALLGSFSRAGWIAGLILLLFFIWVLLPERRQRVRFLGGVILVAVLLFAGGVNFGPERVRSVLSVEPGTTTHMRIVNGQSSLQMIADYPITGVGLDNYLYVHAQYLNPAAWREPNLSHPHNLFLDFWLRLGIVGVVFIVGYLARFFMLTHRIAYSSREKEVRALGVGLAGSQLAAVTHGMLDNYYFLPDLASWFWLTAALCAVVYTTSRKPTSSGEGLKTAGAGPP